MYKYVGLKERVYLFEFCLIREQAFFIKKTCPAVRGGLGRDFVHGADRFTAGRLGGGGSRVLIPSFPSHHLLISVTDLLFLRSHPVKE
jgi:hypothetical protein